MAATITLHVEVLEELAPKARRFVLDTFEQVSPQIVFRPMHNRVYVSFLVDTQNPWEAVEIGAGFLAPIIESAGEQIVSAYVQCNGLRSTLKHATRRTVVRRRLAQVVDEATGDVEVETRPRRDDAAGDWQAEVREAMQDMTRRLTDG